MSSVNKHIPLLTIVMPLYNAEAYIEAALNNILSQSCGDYELLLLDALSTDNTRAIIEKKRETNPNIRFVSEKDKGIYDAMNKGVALARGEWVYFMGCDDGFYNKTVLQNIESFFKDEYDLLYGDVLWVPDEVVEKGMCNGPDLINRNINHQRIFYRTSLFRKYGGYDLQYKVAADHELNIRFFCDDTIRKQYIPLTVARYHSGGFSSNKVDEIFWNNWKAIFRKNFSAHLPTRMMYEKLGWYCRFLIDQQKYAKALPVFLDVLFHTFSPGFVKLTTEQYFKSRKLHGG